jgi:hypothetical protein
MFTIPPIPSRKKYFVVVGLFGFGQRDWYLYDVASEGHTTRQWVSNPKKAIRFNNEDEADQIGALVCKEDEYSVESFTSYT